MAAIHDLIAQIGDARLRERLMAEWAKATRERKFGLVFEDHLPELLPLPKARPRKGDLVCPRGGSLKDLWRVQGFAGGRVQCRRPQPAAEGQPAEAGEFDAAELIVVREFGEPIFPALVPVDAVASGGADAPWHTLIEADNYHALQLLEYLYAGQVDCIYIDPPYNSGARDWKYNNDYVDGTDAWRHSKWLAFMKRRLQIAKKLLNPDRSALIIAIDDNELFSLGLLLNDIFATGDRQLVSVTINPKGKARDGRLSQVDEYLLIVFLGAAVAAPMEQATAGAELRWPYLRRSDVQSARGTKKGGVRQFYPIYVNPETGSIERIGDPLTPDQPLSDALTVSGAVPVFPIREDGKHMNWGLTGPSLSTALSLGLVRVAPSKNLHQQFNFQYVTVPSIAKVERGEYLVSGFRQDGSKIVVVPAGAAVRATTAWRKNLYDANSYGTQMVGAILPGQTFPFPKSVYAVVDALRVLGAASPTCVVVDFFAGSGTTLNAVNLLNAADGGRRRCILVTNNEVSASEADALRERGLQPGDDEWEAQGICRSVTWPRSKFTILGRRDDGTPLPGDYLTGRTRTVERPRRFVQVGFVDPAQLDTVAKRKQVVALIDGLPQTAVAEDLDFIVSEDHAASVLFDPAGAQDWLEVLEGQDHIASFYIVTPVKKLFDQIKAAVTELLGPLQASEDETRPMRDGFAANLAYFKLDFLDPERVGLKRAFREILPLLWLKAGAVGARPELPRGEPEPVLFAPEGGNFIVLLQESRLARLLKLLAARRSPLSHVFIVTDSDEGFKRMAAEARAAAGAAHGGVQVVQLYRDYLANFLINQRQDGDAAGAPA